MISEWADDLNHTTLKANTLSTYISLLTLSTCKSLHTLSNVSLIKLRHSFRKDLKPERLPVGSCHFVDYCNQKVSSFRVDLCLAFAH